MRWSTRIIGLVAGFVTLGSSSLYAQASIAGVVRDASNAVLPGVTVEAASPALIEKVRTVVTDGTGQYKIENLRPGVYSVTFTLSGFSALKREGIELTGTFTASVNVELRVGALEEAITVTGETPVVDVQNTTQQRVLNRELISSLPSGRNAATMAALLPGVTVGNQDVGGIGGESFSSAGGVSIHGNTDVRTQVNGVSVHNAQGNGATGVGNIAAYQEMVVDTSGISAEQAEGGVRMNLIPREGGNTFSGSFFSSFANSSMQGDNFTDGLRARGLATPNSLKRYSDLNPAVGGPIIRDKLWFHATVRFNTALNYAPLFFNKNAGDPNAWTYEPDTSRGPASNDATWKGFNPRLTWQATPRNKVGFSFDYINSCQCPRVTATSSPEANQGSYAFDQPRVWFANWTSPVTNRLLLESVVASNVGHGFRPYSNLYFTHNPGAATLNQVTEQSSNFTYRASSASMTDTLSSTFLPRVTASYITGAHAAKIGIEYGLEAQNQWRYSMDSPMSFRFNNGVPNRITLEATPFRRLTDVTKRSAFAQDKWTVHRLTVSAGLRYDYYQASFPEVTIGPGEFVPTRNFRLPAADGVRWHDLEPRSGLAFDLFGNGKTALKVSLNKYVAALALPNTGGTFTTSMAPSARLVTSTNRSWNDANRNFVPDCILTNPLQNGECGAMDNPNFGTTQPGVAYDPATLTGWGKRDSNWQFAAGVQHEVLPRTSLDVSYFRTWFGNFVVTDDRSRSPADYDQFSIVAPTNSRLPGGGGYTVSGLYDIKLDKFSLPADNYITFADNYGKQTRHWNGVDITVNTRPRSGVSLAGGVSTGRTSTDNCDVVSKVDNPSRLYCHIDEAFLTQVKFLGTYTVPRIDVQVTGTVQSTPGPQIAANYVATNAVVAPSLGRNLAGGANNVTVNLVEPGTMYGQRMNQLDLRVGKILRFGGTRTTASVDLYNVLNASPVLSSSNAFATWQQPLSILNPRFAKLVFQFEF